MATQYSFGKIVTNGLVLCLDAADRNSYVSGSTTWRDVAGSNNGTLTNGPTFNSSNGGSIVFDGVNDYTNLGNPSSLNILTFTICVWARSSTFTDYQNVIFKGDTIKGQYGIVITSTGDWAVQPNTVFLGDLITLNTWNFFTGTYDGTKITAYRNGIQKGQYSISQTNSGNIVTIGADTVNTRYFNGNIALTQIYNRALTATEVLQNYNAQKSRFGLS